MRPVSPVESLWRNCASPGSGATSSMAARRISHVRIASPNPARSGSMAEYRFTHTSVTRNPAHSLVSAVARKAALPSYGDAWLDELYQMGYAKVSVTALEAHVGARPNSIQEWAKRDKAGWD